MNRRWMGVLAKALVVLGVGLPGVGAVAAGAQQPGPGATDGVGGQGGGGHRGQYAGMGRVAGEVTAVSGANITLRTQNGETAEVVTTDNTRVMRDHGPVKVSDLHAGDGLMAFGNLDPATHTLHAAMVMAEDAAQVKAMRENLGKTYITGRVTAIDLDDAKMTVERPDHVSQTIGFDESTSFRRAVRGERRGGGESPGAPGAGGGGRRYGGGGLGMGMGADPEALDRVFNSAESITLADIKVGDAVAGTGSLKGGVFVPTHLLDSPRRVHAEGAPGSTDGAATPEAGAPGPGSR